MSSKIMERHTTEVAMSPVGRGAASGCDPSVTFDQLLGAPRFGRRCPAIAIQLALGGFPSTEKRCRRLEPVPA